MFSGMYTPHGNAKLGKHIGAVNRQAGTTCPGASGECGFFCYAKKGNFLRFGLQRKYGESTLNVPAKLPAAVRIHASGDFDTIEYIQYWIDQVTTHPNTNFWAYTRSWIVPGLLPSLETLRSLPNMQLFASVDPSMPAPPKEWRIAYVELDSRFRGMECLEQNGKMPDCDTCGYCFRKPKGNVKFLMH